MWLEAEFEGGQDLPLARATRTHPGLRIALALGAPSGGGTHFPAAARLRGLEDIGQAALVQALEERFGVRVVVHPERHGVWLQCGLPIAALDKIPGVGLIRAVESQIGPPLALMENGRVMLFAQPRDAANGERLLELARAALPDWRVAARPRLDLSPWKGLEPAFPDGRPTQAYLALLSKGAGLDDHPEDGLPLRRPRAKDEPVP